MRSPVPETLVEKPNISGTEIGGWALLKIQILFQKPQSPHHLEQSDCFFTIVAFNFNDLEGISGVSPRLESAM